MKRYSLATDFESISKYFGDKNGDGKELRGCLEDMGIDIGRVEVVEVGDVGWDL